MLPPNRPTTFPQKSLVMTYVPLSRGIVCVLGEVKAVNLEVLLKLDE